MRIKTSIRESLTFDRSYFIKFVMVLLVEIVIGLYIKDKIIRPYIGDILVIVVMYLFVKTFYKPPTKRLPLYLFVFACLIEMTQLFNMIEVMGLENNKILSILLGTTFDMKDIVSYGIGMMLLIMWEKMLRKNIAYL